MSSQKSHRAKALQSLIDAGPSVLAPDGALQPPASLVKPKSKSKKKSSSGSSKRSSRAGEVEGIKSGKGAGPSRAVEGEDEESGDEQEQEQEQGGEDVRMDEESAGPSSTPAVPSALAPAADDDDEMLIDSAPLISFAPVPPTAPPTTASTDPLFTPLPASAAAASSRGLKNEFRRVPIPPHRLTPLKKEWVNVYGPLVEMMGLQVRMNTKAKAVELKTSRHTQDTGAIQKGADFVKAFALGFNVNDALAILRLEDLYLDSFEVKDVKTLHGDHLSRAIGRVAGQDGKTKFTIENASRTRIVLADTHIHILGSVQNIKIARDAVVSLILGSPPGKVYAHLRTVGARMKQRF